MFIWGTSSCNPWKGFRLHRRRTRAPSDWLSCEDTGESCVNQRETNSYQSPGGSGELRGPWPWGQAFVRIAAWLCTTLWCRRTQWHIDRNFHLTMCQSAPLPVEVDLDQNEMTLSRELLNRRRRNRTRVEVLEGVLYCHHQRSSHTRHRGKLGRKRALASPSGARMHTHSTCHRRSSVGTRGFYLVRKSRLCFAAHPSLRGKRWHRWSCHHCLWCADLQDDSLGWSRITHSFLHQFDLSWSLRDSQELWESPWGAGCRGESIYVAKD